MRKFILLLLTLTWSSVVFCQKVTYKDETIFKDGQPYAKMKKIGSLMTENTDFSVKTLKGKEVIFLKQVEQTYFYECIFRDSDKRAYMEGGDLSNAKRLAKLLVENDLVGENGVNAENEKRFVQLYSNKPAELKRLIEAKNTSSNPSNQSNLEYTMVERERKGEVKVYGESLQQNFEDIGTYQKERDTSKGADIYAILLPNGTKIAEATLIDDAKQCKLVTLKDNKMHTIYLSARTFDSDIAKEIATFLVERYYL